MPEAEKTMEELEMMVDNHSLPHVLEMLAEVCTGKAEHLRSNWQDGPAAKEWERAAAAIERARVKVNALAL